MDSYISTVKMAQSVITILTNLKADLKAKAAAVGLTIFPDNWSVTDYKSLILNTIATQGGIQQQLFDAFTTDIENKIAVASPQTEQWFKEKLINMFEYDAIAVPVVQLKIAGTDVYPYYQNPNPNFRIIKYCSVVPGIFGTVLIKVAGETSGVPSAIGPSELFAAQSFINIITADGIAYTVVSRPSDKLWVKATIYYKGIYSAVIQANVIAAIQNYLKTIPFDGSVELGDLTIAIRKVAGVNRVIFNDIQARKDMDIFGAGVNMVIANTVNLDLYSTFAGYIIPETTVGQQLADTLTFNAE